MATQAEIEAAATELYVMDGGSHHRWPEVWGPARDGLLRRARAALQAAELVRGHIPVDPSVVDYVRGRK
jgi:hypothetical protein